MNVSEHLVRFLAEELACRHAFTLTGGGAMFLNDAFGNDPDLTAIYMHHEQAAAMAAVGYAKLKGFAVCVTTTGCGATNALTGLLDAWQDNVPVLFISGQVKSKETSYLALTKLRGFGVQEANIIPVVSTLSKRASFIDGLDTYFEVLQTLKQDLFGGRPGPVWLDIPMDVQSRELPPDKIKIVTPGKTSRSIPRPSQTSVNKLERMLTKAAKPLFLVGNGLRLSQGGRGIDRLRRIAERSRVPVVSTYLGVDFFPADSRIYFGPIGTKASRVANVLVNNADLVICLGTRLATSATGFEYEKFAPLAKKVVIDIDPLEHRKGTVAIDLFIKSDACAAVEEIQRLLHKKTFSEWLNTSSKAAAILPRQEQHSPAHRVSIFDAVRCICEGAGPDDVLVSDAGSAYYVASMLFKKSARQRYITSGAQADMGFGLPAGIGCTFASKRNSRTHIITGDGSLQLNIQELQTLLTYDCNATLYVLNNNGYLSIRGTQDTFFPGRQCGTDKSNGVDFPNLRKVAKAYGLAHTRVTSQAALRKCIAEQQKSKGPRVIEIMCPENEAIIPRAMTVKNSDGKLVSQSLSNMAPPLGSIMREQLSKIGIQVE
jgi:acetolactate synthase-1/2/3 large subunit